MRYAIRYALYDSSMTSVIFQVMFFLFCQRSALHVTSQARFVANFLSLSCGYAHKLCGDFPSLGF